MKKIIILIISMLTWINYIQAQDQSTKQIEGTWIVDLTPRYATKPHLKELEIKLKDKNSFEGSFYNGTPFKNGELSTAEDIPCFAFTTKAGKTVYFSSGYFKNGQLEGMTYADNLDFIMPWKAKRKEEITK